MTGTVQTVGSAPPDAVVAEPLAEEVDRYAAVEQYSLAKILGVWAAAAVPMGVLAWIVAPCSGINSAAAIRSPKRS